jgi:hypothetical protein
MEVDITEFRVYSHGATIFRAIWMSRVRCLCEKSKESSQWDSIGHYIEHTWALNVRILRIGVGIRVCS